MRKGIIGVLLLLAAAGVGAGTYYKMVYEPQNGSIFEARTESGRAVSVDSVAVIVGIPNADGIIQHYAGVVEAQQEWSAKADGEKKIAKTYVKEGDMVEIGDDLFAYDTSVDEYAIEKNEISLDRLANDSDSRKAKIEQLEKQIKAASDEEEKLSLQTQILLEENQIKQNNYDAKTTAAEIEKLKEAVKSSTVKSEIEGIVKSVGKKSSSSMNDEDEGYITIMAVGDFRVKGYANEQNINLITEGMPMVAYSRVDPDDKWTGSITEIKREGEKNSSKDPFYNAGDTSTASSEYPFYISLDYTDGLFLGQHVYIEEDLGQNNESDGLWIHDCYFDCDDDGRMFVWAEGSNGKIEKRFIETGDFDEELSRYEVVSGIADEDYIAVPGQEIMEGQPVVHTEYSDA